MQEKTSILRTRFAPSPTGHLHVGSARTALFCWLFARKQRGTFILRVEDTDRERSSQESIQAILDGMEWLGLDYDEGPFFQTQRFDRYKQVIQQLLDEGKAYRCYCSAERLEKMRQEQLQKKEKPRYDGRCREQSVIHGNQPYVIRFKNPLNGVVTFHDYIRGSISVDNAEMDDLIIARSDGTPTYNFTVVVDDWDMKITDVIRGDDHINNTPRQINILQALGAELPRYAHLPMILGGDGKRLSKRHGAVSLQQYREEGYLPEAMLNYLARLGWGHGDQEIFTRDEMIQAFGLDSVNKSPAIFNVEKLNWLNQHYMKTMDYSAVAKHVAAQFTKVGINCSVGPEVEDIVSIQAERTKTIVEMVERSRYFYENITEYDENAKKNLTADTTPILEAIYEKLQALAEWNKENLHQVLLTTTEEKNLKLGKVAQPVRVALTGGTTSPPMDITMYLIGREKVLARLRRAIEFARNHG